MVLSGVQGHFDNVDRTQEDNRTDRCAKSDEWITSEPQKNEGEVEALREVLDEAEAHFNKPATIVRRRGYRVLPCLG